eukprot:TRINITY_DN2712_c0_g2_i1.p1 TRINITY_DN2712_c0_g2~~TRINITY_DN2712_c0_g2_i1.p1  ORF type:complete len:748 (+),score=266.53 TRINITY_DN2712_c0_g2_i1:27-2270(+)
MSNPEIARIAKVQRSHLQVGDSADIDAAREAFNQAEMEKLKDACHEWIQSVLDDKTDLDFFDYIRDGKALCMVVNRIEPGITKFHKMARGFLALENHHNFVKSCAKLGLPSNLLYNPTEFYENKNIYGLVLTVWELAKESTMRGFEIQINKVSGVSDEAKKLMEEELHRAQHVAETMDNVEDEEEEEEPEEVEADVDFNDIDLDGIDDYVRMSDEPGDIIKFSFTLPYDEDAIAKIVADVDSGEVVHELVYNDGEWTLDWSNPPDRIDYKLLVEEDGESYWETGPLRTLIITKADRVTPLLINGNWRNPDDETSTLKLVTTSGSQAVYRVHYNSIEGDDLVEAIPENPNETDIIINKGGIGFMEFRLAADSEGMPISCLESLDDVVSIDMSYLWISDEAVGALLELCPNAFNISLSGCEDLTAQAIVDVTSMLGDRLQSLSLRNCRNLLPSDLVPVFTQCPSLTAIDLSKCQKMNSTTIIALCKKFKSSLTSLKIGGCDRIDDKAADSIANLENLTVLDVNRCGSLSNEAVLRIIDGNRLKELDISSRTLTEDLITSISKLVDLENLNVSWCDISSSNFVLFESLVNLVILDASNNDDLDDNAVNALKSDKLKELHLTDLNISDESVVPIVERCKETLRVLNVGGTQCKEVFKTATSVQKLESLNMRKCEIDGEQLVEYAKLKCLKLLGLNESEGIEREHIVAFIQNRPKSDIFELTLDLTDVGFDSELKEELEEELGDLELIDLLL